jgi:hypothetical protein
MAVWVNGKPLDTSMPKARKWKPAEKPAPQMWGLCPCGAIIMVGDTVIMYGDHEKVVCFDCRDALPEGHIDCAGLHFPDVTLEG